MIRVLWFIYAVLRHDLPVLYFAIIHICCSSLWSTCWLHPVFPSLCDPSNPFTTPLMLFFALIHLCYFRYIVLTVSPSAVNPPSLFQPLCDPLSFSLAAWSTPLSPPQRVSLLSPPSSPSPHDLFVAAWYTHSPHDCVTRPASPALSLRYHLYRSLLLSRVSTAYARAGVLG